MAKGKKGKKSKQDEDAEWDALEAKKSSKVDDLANQVIFKKKLKIKIY